MTGFNKFAQIADALTPTLHEVVTETAQSIIDTYSATAPVDTGFMASSGYIVTNDQSTYGQGALAPPKDAYLLPEVEAPSDPLTASAAIGANYAIYQEFGTRSMPAQPAFYPAVEAARQTLQDKLDAIEPRLQGHIA